MKLRSDRAGLPETESLTTQRSCQGSKTTEGRKRAPRAHADLDRENDVIRWVDTATHTPTTPLHWISEIVFPASKARRARVAWRGPVCRQSRPLVRTKRESARLERASRFSRSRKSLWLGSGWIGSDPRQTPDDNPPDAVFERQPPELSHQRSSPSCDRPDGAALPCSCNDVKRDCSDRTPSRTMAGTPSRSRR